MTSTERFVAGKGDARTVGIDGLRAVVEELRAGGRDVLGPVVRDGAIVIRSISSADDLPTGIGAEHAPGASRLTSRDDRCRFGWAVGAQSWKPVLHPSRVRTIAFDRPGPTSTAADDGVAVTVVSNSPERPLALFGVRPCELAAIAKTDRVLIETAPSPEPVYARRRDVLVVAVDCHEPAATCFCSSMGTGPTMDDLSGGRSDRMRSSDVADVRITELPPDDHRNEPSYLVRACSDAGTDLLDRLVRSGHAGRPAGTNDLERAAATGVSARERMGRSVDAVALPLALRSAARDEAWSDIAERCVACGNCTAVCPTCFCTSLDDVGDLTGDHVDRWRRWASCFELEFSRVGDSPVRTSIAARYRQWYTHKFASWFDQFGESGCVGCGRCITWCPVGIDVTEEAQRFVGSGTPEVSR